MSFFSHSDQAAFFGGAAKKLDDTGFTDSSQGAREIAARQGRLANKSQVGIHFATQLGVLFEALASLPPDSQGYSWQLHTTNRSDVDIPRKRAHLHGVLAHTALSWADVNEKVVSQLGRTQGTLPVPRDVLTDEPHLRLVFFGVASSCDANTVKPGALRLYTTLITAQAEDAQLPTFARMGGAAGEGAYRVHFYTESERRGTLWTHEDDPALSFEKLGKFIAPVMGSRLPELERDLMARTFPKRDYTV